MKAFIKVCCLLPLLVLPLAGCGGASEAEPETPEVGELEQFLRDNPDVANEEEEEPGEEEG